jgi:hypothetical protein
MFPVRLKSRSKSARMTPRFRSGMVVCGIRKHDIGDPLVRPHRLVGLGHRAFNAATRVRIPLGTPILALALQRQNIKRLILLQVAVARPFSQF